MDLSFVAIDVETANPDRASICQVGAVAVREGENIDTLILLEACTDTGLDVPGWLGRASQAVQSISRDGQGDDDPLAGEVIVFTGTLSVPRSQAAAEAASFGCDVRNSVSRSTTILVVGQQGLQALNGYTKSSKQRKAEALARQGVGIKILGEDDFRRMGATV